MKLKIATPFFFNNILNEFIKFLKFGTCAKTLLAIITSAIIFDKCFAILVLKNLLNVLIPFFFAALAVLFVGSIP